MPTFANLRDFRVTLSRLDGGDALRRVCEIVLVALLGLQAARLAWLLLPPAGLTPQATVPLDGPQSTPEWLSLDAFHPHTVPVATANTSGLRLFAVRPGPRGGSAIIATQDGPQQSFAVGDAIAPGVSLVAVRSDHAVIESGGVRGTLRFAALEAGTGPVRTPAAAGPSAARHGASTAVDAGESGPIDPAQLLAAMGLRPEEMDGRITGYTIFPRGDAAVLRQAGLQAGDVLLSVNNEALDPERHAALATTLAGASSISLTFRRDGQVRRVTLQARTP